MATEKNQGNIIFAKIYIQWYLSVLFNFKDLMRIYIRGSETFFFC